MSFFFDRAEIWRSFDKSKCPKVEDHPGRYIKAFYVVEQRDWTKPFKFRKAWKKASMFKRFFCLADSNSPVRYSNKLKRQIVLHYYLRTVLFPSFKKTPWKNYLKQKFKKHSFYLVQDFLWFFASRADHLIVKLGLRNKLSEAVYLVKQGYISANGVISTPGSRVPLHSVLHFNYLVHLLDAYRWANYGIGNMRNKLVKLAHGFKKFFRKGLYYNRRLWKLMLLLTHWVNDYQELCVFDALPVYLKLVFSQHLRRNYNLLKSQSWISTKRYASFRILFKTIDFSELSLLKRKSYWKAMSLAIYNDRISVSLSSLKYSYNFASVKAKQQKPNCNVLPALDFVHFYKELVEHRIEFSSAIFSWIKVIFGWTGQVSFWKKTKNLSSECYNKIFNFIEDFYSFKEKYKILRRKGFRRANDYRRKQFMKLLRRRKTLKKRRFFKDKTVSFYPDFVDNIYQKFSLNVKDSEAISRKTLIKKKVFINNNFKFFFQGKSVFIKIKAFAKIQEKIYIKLRKQVTYREKLRGKLKRVKLKKLKKHWFFFSPTTPEIPLNWFKRYKKNFGIGITLIMPKAFGLFNLPFYLTLKKYSRILYVHKTKIKRLGKGYIKLTLSELEGVTEEKYLNLQLKLPKGLDIVRKRLMFLENPRFAYRGFNVKKFSKSAFKSLNRFVLFSKVVQSFYFFKNYYSVIDNNFRNVYWRKTWFSAKNLSSYLVGRIYNSRNRI